MRKNFDEFIKTSEAINGYLDLLLYSLCSRCAILDDIPNSKENLLWNVHHYGHIHQYMAGIDNNMANNWLDDIEHGLFHGFCTGIGSGVLLRKEFEKINATMSNPSKSSTYRSSRFDREISFDQLNASCLFHDLLKSNGCDHREQKNHDKDLKAFIPNLLPQTYSHIHPKKYNHPFLIADVLELRRYKDYLQWYKSGKIERLITKEESKLFDCFYTNIRPSLMKCFVHREEAWAKHGAEIPQDLSVNKYPQNKYEPFPFEIDRLPFSRCFDHGICTDTGYVNSWAIFKGIIPVSDFKKKGKIILDHPQKHDVLHAQFNTGFEDWVFVVNYKEDSLKYQTKWVIDLVEDLLKRGHRVVHQDTLNKFIHLTNVISDRMKFLSCIKDANI